MFNHYTIYIQPLVEYCSTPWKVGCLGDLRLFENVQSRWVKSITGFDAKSYRKGQDLLD